MKRLFSFTTHRHFFRLTVPLAVGVPLGCVALVVGMLAMASRFPDAFRFAPDSWFVPLSLGSSLLLLALAVTGAPFWFVVILGYNALWRLCGLLEISPLFVLAMFVIVVVGVLVQLAAWDWLVATWLRCCGK